MPKPSAPAPKAEPAPPNQPAPKPAEPPAVTPPKKPVEMTPEELEAAGNEFISRQFPGYQLPKKKEEPPAEKPPEPVAKPAEEPPKKEEPPAKPEPEPPAKPVEVSPPISEFKIPTAEPEPPKRKEEEDEYPLSKREQAELGVFAAMAELEPKYRDLSAAYRSYLPRARKYIAAWMEKNPGSKFVASEEEHARWFADNYPRFDEDDYKMAERQVIKKEALAESRALIAQEIERVRKETTLERKQPEISNVASESVVKMMGLVDTTLTERLKKDSRGRLYADEATIKELEEGDPLMMDALKEEAEQLHVLVTELEKLAADPDNFKFDKGYSVHLEESDRRFHPHAELERFLTEYERAMLKLPPDKTAREGKRLIGWEQHADLVERIKKAKLGEREEKRSIDDLNSRYYTLGGDDYRAGMEAVYANRTKKTIEKRRSRYKQTAPNPSPPKTVEPPASAGQNNLPSLASKSDSVDTSKSISPEAEQELKQWMNRAFGKVS